MKDSLLYLTVFIIGLALALWGVVPQILLSASISKWILYGLLFFVGIQIGSSKGAFLAIRSIGSRIVWVPVATTLGTFVAAAIASFVLPSRSLTDCLSVGSGFAYYSLSSILITGYRGAELGTVALLANIFREFMVLVFAPWIVKHFGPLAPICAGGATTMDTTLPVITRYSGTDYVAVALFHGMLIDFSVPLWVSFFAGM